MCYFTFGLSYKKLLSLLILYTNVSIIESADKSAKYKVKTADYPFLVLIDVKPANGSSYQLSGCLASLSWVLTVSHALAQLPTGILRYHKVTVYAELTSREQMTIATQRVATRVVTNLLSEEDNTYFPNLVLLRLNSRFLGGKARPVVFNIGKLSSNSWLVGWASDIVNKSLDNAVALMVSSKPADICNRAWAVSEFPQQICVTAIHQVPEQLGIRLTEGALLIDQGYLTGLLQLNLNFPTSNVGTVIASLVRIGFYITWIQFIVPDPIPTMIFLETGFIGDDLIVPPWQKPKSTAVSRINRNILNQFPLLMPSKTTHTANIGFSYISET